VIAAVGGSRKAAVARELGAHLVIDYTDPAWKSRLSGTGIDVVFDGVGGDVGRAAFDLLRAGGRFCAFGMASGAFAPLGDGEATARGVKLIRGVRARLTSFGTWRGPPWTPRLRVAGVRSSAKPSASSVPPPHTPPLSKGQRSARRCCW